MSGDTPWSEDDDLLAAELALGLLDAPEAAAAGRRLSADARFAGAHARWLAAAVNLFHGPAEMPPAWLERAIVDRLPANDVVGGATVRRWQIGTAIATTAAVALGLVALQRPEPPRPVVEIARSSPPLVVILRGKSAAVVAVSFDRTASRLTTTPSTVSIGRHAAELWVIPVGGTPHSLGVVSAEHATSRTIQPPALAFIQPGASLAISIEPLGGSVTGQPTGAIIVSGKVEAS